jgi:hypothetical protein
MSFFGNKEEARKWAMEGDMQIDDLMTTSPVGAGGGMEAGAAPMSGKSEFTNERTRMKFVGNQSGMRREFPSEGVGNKSGV